MGSTPTAIGGGTNSLPPGSPYAGGTVTGQSTFSGPQAQTSFQPPNMASPSPMPGSAPMGPGSGSAPYSGLWTGFMLGSLLSQALAGSGPMPGGMNPMGAPSPFGSSGFTPGLRGQGGGIGSMPQGGAGPGR